MRLINADALKEDFKSRLTHCNDWIEKAKDKETKIRASAVKAFIGEVIMTIDNAPTVDMDERDADAFETGYIKGICEQNPQGEWVTVRKYYDDFLKNIIYECSCSVCGARFPFAQIPETSEECYYHFDYCPSCGARMGGGEE